MIDSSVSGGGNVENSELNHFGPSIRWMTYEASGCGLRIPPFTEEWKSVQPSVSLTWIWWMLELLPIPHLSYQDRTDIDFR